MDSYFSMLRTLFPDAQMRQSSSFRACDMTTYPPTHSSAIPAGNDGRRHSLPIGYVTKLPMRDGKSIARQFDWPTMMATKNPGMKRYVGCPMAASLGPRDFPFLRRVVLKESPRLKEGIVVHKFFVSRQLRVALRLIKGELEDLNVLLIIPDSSLNTVNAGSTEQSACASFTSER
jgi:hypothetical protein